MNMDSELHIDLTLPSISTQETLQLDEESNLDVSIPSRLLQRTGGRDGGLAMITKGLQSRVVRLRECKLEEEGVVFVPPSIALLFNRKLLLDPFLHCGVRTSVTLSALTVDEERKADRVVLKRIGLPRREYIVSTEPTEESVVIQQSMESVRNYFSSTRRFVSKGDVLIVPVGDAGLLPECRYYRVAVVEPLNDCVAVFVDPSHTVLSIQGEFSGGFLPLSLQQYHYIERVLRDGVESSPSLNSGPLRVCWKEVAEIIAPVLLQDSTEISYRLGLLVSGSVGKTTSVIHAARFLGLKHLIVDCLDLQNNSVGEVYHQLDTLKNGISRWIEELMTEKVTHNPAEIILNVLQDFTSLAIKQNPEECVILVGTCDEPGDLCPPLRHVFTYEIEIPELQRNEINTLLRYYIHQFELEDSIEDLEGIIGLISEEMVSPDLRALSSFCYRLKVHSTSSPESSKLDKEKIRDILEQYRAGKDVGKIHVAEVPKVQWSDIGGLEEIKDLIRETVELPIKHRSLFPTGVQKRLGVLLHGPPGVGKTLLAKAIATECKTKFMSIKGPELLDMYVGETERMVRDLFDRAKKASPCVLFFDELDAFVPSRGAEDSGSVMDRVVSQFLTEMDEVAAGHHDVFIFGATNRLDLIDPALLRPGRFDKLVKVEPPKSIASKISVLTSLTRKFQLGADVNLEGIAHGLGEDTSGADLYALCSDAWTKACKRLIDEIELEGKSEESALVEVKQEDFMKSLEESIK